MINITKPLRKKIALALAAEVGRVFETDAQKIELEEGGLCGSKAEDYHTAGWPCDRCVYPIATGELSVAVEVSPRLVSLFCRLAPNAGIGVPLTTEEKVLARLVDGNHFSGKVNLHLAPQGRVTEADIEGFVLRARDHLLKLKHGGYYDRKLLEAA